MNIRNIPRQERDGRTTRINSLLLSGIFWGTAQPKFLVKPSGSSCALAGRPRRRRRELMLNKSFLMIPVDGTKQRRGAQLPRAASSKFPPRPSVKEPEAPQSGATEPRLYAGSSVTTMRLQTPGARLAEDAARAMRMEGRPDLRPTQLQLPDSHPAFRPPRELQSKGPLRRSGGRSL